MLVQDRTEAGRLLGERLAQWKLDRPIVYALPRGGVAVAADVADEVVTVATPEPFGDVGAFYLDFHQLSDAEVAEHLRGAASAHP